ncbi:unnamed protein product [Brassicogethes aeneus]|uniref:Uncharacterized protein n=1 Tax=Brassicogethes aeneus TaxID=1431903 RepID=A0A9P0FB65_BRAAE|nr:unnamed protein product [Brassicogethes aeneus]
MFVKFLFLVCCVCLSYGLPTMYKLNENKVLEPDLIPVSSTVIPLPVYQVGYGLNVSPSKHDEKIKKPEGPISLVTVHNQKKATGEKQKLTDASSIKELKL